MDKRRLAQKIEKIVIISSTLLFAYLVARTYILSRWDWGYIRGPLAPRHYYELGLLDEPIPSAEYYPFTLIPTPTPLPMLDIESPRDIIEPAEFIQDSSPSAENTTEELD